MISIKKVLSAVIAATTVCAMSASAFATASSAPSYTLGGSGATKGIVLSITVPSTLSFLIDPYSTTEGKGQVYSAGTNSAAADYSISSGTAVPVNVMVTSCKGTIPSTSGLKLTGATPPDATSTTKQAQLFLRAEVGETTLDTDGARYRAATAVKAGDVLVSTSGSANSLLVQLPAGTTSSPSKAAIGITGAVSTNVLWEETDTVDVNVALNIVPQPLS